MWTQQQGMALEHLYRDILSLLLASSPQDNCRLELRELFRRLNSRRSPRHFLSSVRDLERYLLDCTKLFEVDPYGRDSVSVSPKTSLTICRRHSNKGGSCRDGTCPDIHFCVFFLLSGQCNFGDRCHFGHMLSTPHNRRLLERHLLWGVPITGIRMLLCLPAVRQGVTRPQVCRYYNGPKGCIKGDECFSLHLCLHYVFDQCKFGKGCKNNHEIDDPQVTKVLTLYGVKERRNLDDILQEVRLYNENSDPELDWEDEEVGHRHRRPMQDHGAKPRRFDSVPNPHRGREMSLFSQPQGAARRAPSASGRAREQHPAASSYARLANRGSLREKTEELCVYHLQGKCKFNERCNLLHNAVPYMWRLSPADERGGGDGVSRWKGLPSHSNITLEKAFCQPQETVCIVTDEYDDEVEIEFGTMTALNKRTQQQYNVRRVSTQSTMHPSLQGSGSSPLHDFGTVWLWYWKQQDGSWAEFGLEEGRLPFTSGVLEKRYQMSRSVPFKFKRFVLDFQRMHVKDSKADRKYRVTRRPQLVLGNDDAESGTESDSDGDYEDPRTCSDKDDDDDEDIDEGPDANDDGDGVEDDKDDEARASTMPASELSPDNILRTVHDTSETFTEVKTRFRNTLGVPCTVLSIHSVHNPLLEARYSRMRSSVRQELGTQRVEEKGMYYGPSADEDITSIYTSGVDFNSHKVAMTDTAAQSEGGCFHVNAARANKKTGGKSKRFMFVMKCLLVSGRVDDAKTVVISNPSQVCPEYMITYQLSGSTSTAIP